MAAYLSMGEVHHIGDYLSWVANTSAPSSPSSHLPVPPCSPPPSPPSQSSRASPLTATRTSPISSFPYSAPSTPTPCSALPTPTPRSRSRRLPAHSCRSSGTGRHRGLWRRCTR